MHGSLDVELDELLLGVPAIAIEGLKAVPPPRGLRVLGVFDGPEEDLGQQSEEIIRNGAGRQ